MILVNESMNEIDFERQASNQRQHGLEPRQSAQILHGRRSREAQQADYDGHDQYVQDRDVRPGIRPVVMPSFSPT